MEKATKKQADVFCIEGTKMIQYSLSSKVMDFCIAEIKGRFPKENKYNINYKLTALQYVMKGKGKLHIYDEASKCDKVTPICKTDCYIIPPMEKYYIEGNVTIAVVCNPSYFSLNSK